MLCYTASSNNWGICDLVVINALNINSVWFSKLNTYIDATYTTISASVDESTVRSSTGLWMPMRHYHIHWELYFTTFVEFLRSYVLEGVGWFNGWIRLVGRFLVRYEPIWMTGCYFGHTVSNAYTVAIFWFAYMRYNWIGCWCGWFRRLGVAWSIGDNVLSLIGNGFIVLAHWPGALWFPGRTGEAGDGG